MHFTYCDPSLNPERNVDLSQGDILTRTPEIDALLREYHPHYEQNDQNKYFIVLTQTCDLVRERGDDPCKSKYIAISPIRPLSLVIEKKIESLKDKKIQFSMPVCADRIKKQVSNFLSKLFNNNETEYFYLHEDESLQFPESSCVFLRLSISIKAKENYQTCMKARILGLDESFRDKLGWALGQIYSRVGTQDWNPSALKEMLNKHISDAAIWVPDKQIKPLQKAIKNWQEDNEDQILNRDSLDEMLKSIKSKKESVIDIIDNEINASPEIAGLIENGSLKTKDVKRIINRLNSHAQLATLLK